MAAERLFGVAINPHSFRSIAATLLAREASIDSLFARLLLGHRTDMPTEKHHVHATATEGSRNVNVLLCTLRDRVPEAAPHGEAAGALRTQSPGLGSRPGRREYFQ